MTALIGTLILAVELGPVAQPPTGVAELTRLETVWNEAHVAGDRPALEPLWAEELVVTVPGMPVMSRRDALAILRSGRVRFERYETSELTVRVFGDAAVVTGRLLRVRRTAERRVEDRWFFTKTYVRRDGRWQVVAWHASEQPAP